MTLRSLVLLLLVPALVAALIACGDDDGGADGDNAGPDATEVVDGNGDDAGDDGDTGDDGDDSDGDGGSDDRGSADSRGSGTVVVGDQTFDVDVDTCIVDSSDSIIIAGASTTADGQDVYISAESIDSPHTQANVDVGIGSTSLFDVERGDPHYESAGYTADAEFIPPNVTNPDLVVETNGETHISFTGDFRDVEDVLFEATGSVDMTCQ